MFLTFRRDFFVLIYLRNNAQVETEKNKQNLSCKSARCKFFKSLSVWPWKALTNDTFLCSSKYRIDLHKNIAFITGAINDMAGKFTHKTWLFFAKTWWFSGFGVWQHCRSTYSNKKINKQSGSLKMKMSVKSNKFAIGSGK